MALLFSRIWWSFLNAVAAAAVASIATVFKNDHQIPGNGKLLLYVKNKLENDWGGQCHFGPGRSMLPLAREANVGEVNVITP